MGREIRRVPLDFDWPIRKTWKGYINPHYRECAWCRGHGETKEKQRFDEFCRRIITAAEASQDRPEGYTPSPKLTFERNKSSSHGTGMFGTSVLETYMHRKSGLPRWPWPEHDPVEVMLAVGEKDRDWLTETEEMVIRRSARIEVCDEFYQPKMTRYEWKDGKRSTVMDVTGTTYYPHPYLCWEDGIPDVGNKFHEILDKFEFDLGGLGCSSYSYRLGKAIKKHVGLPYEVVEKETYSYESFDWGLCPHCKGEGRDPACEEAYEAWEDYEPPEGDAYQIWETTSEGSPITPPFASPEELARWAADNGTSTFGSETTSYENWLKFIRGPGWAPSMVAVEHGDGTGVIGSGVDFAASQEEDPSKG